MIKKIQVYFIFLFVLSVQISFGQTAGQFPPHLPQIVPVSPEAASLGKFGDVPVNLSIGKLNYFIPLYTIKVGDFTYPIYLQYNSTGLKAEEDPALVGLGWTLNAEGMITRQVRGLNDDKANGYLHFGQDIINHESGYPNSQWWHDYFQNSIRRVADTEPDKFIVNAGNHQATFFFNEYQEAIFYPNTNDKVVYYASGNKMDSLRITNDKGIKYHFRTPEETEIDENEMMPEYFSSWKLDLIDFPNSLQKIKFHYKKDMDSLSNIYKKTTHSEARYEGVVPYELQSILMPIVTETSTLQKILENIEFPNGKIVFVTDVVPPTSKSRNRYYLKEIQIYTGSNNNYSLLKKYIFEYDNLESNFKLLKRIRLLDPNDNEQPFYSFDYYDEAVVPEDIPYTSQDSWGYYNGKRNNSLIYGDRSVNLHATRLGALKTIHYPTGGMTDIEYELNKVYYLDPLFQFAGQCASTPYTNNLNIHASSAGLFPQDALTTLTIDRDQTIRVYFYATAGGQYAEANADMDVLSGSAQCNPYATCNEGCAMHESAWQEMTGSVNDQNTGDSDGDEMDTNPNSNSTVEHNFHVSYYEVTAGTILQFSVSATAQCH